MKLTKFLDELKKRGIINYEHQNDCVYLVQINEPYENCDIDAGENLPSEHAESLMNYVKISNYDENGHAKIMSIRICLGCDDCGSEEHAD